VVKLENSCFCRNCGIALASEARFCGACGSPSVIDSQVPASTSGKMPRRSRVPLYVAATVTLFVLLIVMGVFSSDAAKTSIPVNAHKIGESVSVGYWSYVCNGVSWQQSIGSEFLKQTPDAEFLIVDLTIRNNDKTASVLAPLKLVDAQGREYEESSKGMFMDRSFGMLKGLNPSVSSRGTAVFDVPRGNYGLRVSGGFGSGKSETIDLQ
jgi:Domain of unknown function (DUF4352)